MHIGSPNRTALVMVSAVLFAGMALGAQEPAGRVTLSGNTHPLARSEFDRGPVDPGLPMGW